MQFHVENMQWDLRVAYFRRDKKAVVRPATYHQAVA